MLTSSNHFGFPEEGHPESVSEMKLRYVSQESCDVFWGFPRRVSKVFHSVFQGSFNGSGDPLGTLRVLRNLLPRFSAPCS